MVRARHPGAGEDGSALVVVVERYRAFGEATVEDRLERIEQLRDPQAALAWLYRIATTVSLDRLRQRQPPTVALDTVAAAGSEAEEAVGDRDRHSLLASALETSVMSECVQHCLAAPPDD